jgi:hypothetical protein
MPNLRVQHVETRELPAIESWVRLGPIYSQVLSYEVYPFQGGHRVEIFTGSEKSFAIAADLDGVGRCKDFALVYFSDVYGVPRGVVASAINSEGQYVIAWDVAWDKKRWWMSIPADSAGVVVVDAK